MKVEFNFVFDRKKKVKKPSDEGLIELRAYYNAKTKYLSTKILVPKSEWNPDKEKIYSRYPGADQLNDDLQRLLERLNNSRREAEFKNQSFDLENVKHLIRTQNTRISSYTEFALKEVNENNFLKEVTKRSHRNSIRKLKEYNTNKDVLFSDLNHSFLDGFINYLKGLSLSQNTIRKHNKNTKTIIERAIKKGHFDKANPCKEIKIKELETKTDVLTWVQINKLDAFNFEAYENKLEIIRDMFLFSCYTGLRISDLTNLKLEYVKQTADGLILDFFTQKVNKHAIIPLYNLFPIPGENTTRPLKILSKYMVPGNLFLFPKYTDQYINRELKTIAAMVGIEFNLTSHIGRKSFATIMARKVSTPSLKRLLQHSNIKTTEKYVHLSDKMVSDDLLNTNWD